LSFAQHRTKYLVRIRENSLRLQGRAERAARLAARDRARDTTGESAHIAEGGRDAPAGNPPHHAAAALLSAKAHVGGRRGTDPGQLTASAGRRTRRACANRTILPARQLLKPSKITVKAVCDRRPTGHWQHHQVHVHAKTTLRLMRNPVASDCPVLASDDLNDGNTPH